MKFPSWLVNGFFLNHEEKINFTKCIFFLHSMAYCYSLLFYPVNVNYKHSFQMLNKPCILGINQYKHVSNMWLFYWQIYLYLGWDFCTYVHVPLFIMVFSSFGIKLHCPWRDEYNFFFLKFLRKFLCNTGITYFLKFCWDLQK